jgi:cation:H+ antiporter
MIGASLLTLLLALDGRIGRLDGTLLFAGVVAYTVFAVRQSRGENAAVRAEYDEAVASGKRPRHAGRWLLDAGAVVIGLGLLVLGARWLVAGAVAAATALGVSELVVGLTVVAMGTSLPELATSVLAARRRQCDIAVGNVVGSNLFNLLAVLGLGSAVAPGGVPVARAALTFDLPVMIAVAVACLPIFFTAHRISRWEGWLFLAYYGAYVAYLVLASTEHDALPGFSAALGWFALPLTAVTLALLAFRAARSRR